MSNYVLDRRQELSQNNYVLKASPENDYWVAFAKDSLDEYLERRGDEFSLLIAGSEDVEGDFYAIPYSQVGHMLTTASMYSEPRRRWVASIAAHEMRVRNYPMKLDVSSFYGRVDGLSQAIRITEEEVNDYAIENRKLEIAVRIRQSQFRQRVLENFGHRCCLSGIAEPDLLVAGHIVPWAESIETRLDPANGICLSVLYDKLFDAGYISLDDSLRVVVTDTFPTLSEALQLRLEQIRGIRISAPLHVELGLEFVRYHRQNVLRSDGRV